MNIENIDDMTKNQEFIDLAVQRVITRIDDLGKALETVKSYQQMWEATFDNVEDCIAVLSSDGVVTNYNKRFKEIVNKSHGEIIGQHIGDLFCDFSDKCSLLHLTNIKRKFRKELLELNKKIFNVNINPFTNGSGQCVFVANDITDLVGAKLRYSNYFEAAPYGLLIIDPETAKIIEFNRQACEQLGYTREEFAGFTPADIDAMHTTLRDVHLRLDIALRDGQTKFETVLITKQKELRNFIVTLKSIKITDRDYIIMAIFDNVTEQRKTKQLLEEEKEKYKAFFESSPDGIIVVDPYTKDILEFNHQMARQLGYTDDEFAKIKITEIDTEKNQECIANRFDNTLALGSNKYKCYHKTKQGQIREILASVKVLKIQGKTLLYAILTDITKQNQGVL